mgnify:CR=1 FL=1
MPSKSSMQDAEDACAHCEKACVDVLQYPDNIMNKINRSKELQGSAVCY